MISDHYRTLIRRSVTLVPDLAGQFTESHVDSEIRGFLAILSGGEIDRHKKLSIDAQADLHTDAQLKLRDKVVDGDVEYEVAYSYPPHYGVIRHILKRTK